MIFLKMLKLIKCSMVFSNRLLAFINQMAVMGIMIFFVMFYTSSPLMAEVLNSAEQNNNAPDVMRAVANYTSPDAEVLRMDGKKLSFIKEIDDGRPVVMNFIFASCSAICPMLSNVFSQVQTKLGKDSNVHLVSISIDPENDTPANLSEYAKKFRAKSGWDFYTATMEASLSIQKAYDAYRGDKMNHSSVILMRAAPGKPWLRLAGFIDTDTVIREYRELIR